MPPPERLERRTVRLLAPETITRLAVTRSRVTWSPVTTIGPFTLTFRTMLPSPETVSPPVSLALLELAFALD